MSTANALPDQPARRPSDPEGPRCARHQWLVFGSGERLSREQFRELSSTDVASGVAAFKELMHASLALEERRAGILSTISRSASPDPVEFLSLWLDAHALGHLALLAFRGDHAWFAEMVRELRPVSWTPTHALVCERIMSVALRGAVAVGRLGSTALEIYGRILESPAQPLEHFDAVLALASVALQQPALAPAARSAVEEWASRATSGLGFRKELRLSFERVLDDPGLARAWSLAWCRDLLERRGALEARATLAVAERFGASEEEILLLTALGHSGDCAVLVDGLFPTILLLSHVCARSADELYAPAAIVRHLSDRWTPQLGVDVLRRSIADAAERPRPAWS